ncbi:MAG: glycosyltransferase family 39 protein, partial [Patescibacteria group bacterium]
MSKSTIFLLAVIFVAFVMRSQNLGNNPPAAYGDEISFAWNAWNILKTGTDEYGVPYPLQFRAFDDYKAPIPVYILVPFLRALGLNTFAVRFPVVLFSVATIWITYLLGKRLINGKIGLIAAFLLTISSWHLHLSRGFFESTISLFFFVTATYFFVEAKDDLRKLIFSAIFFALTLYSYFTPRI